MHLEPHELRYWEEELQLGIKRNEMGHRCYTQKDIETFSRIKLLKEQGLQLKAIRMVLQGDNEFLYREEKRKDTQAEEEIQKEKETLEEKVEDMVMKKAKKYMVTMSKGKETVVEMPREELKEYEEPEDEKTKKAARLQYLLQHMVTEAVKNANQEMCTEIKESILKELDYQFRQQEERDEAHWKQEEEHYRKIDEMIRQRHSPKTRFGKAKIE
ncbi:MAG: helix-turn-helix domain-containing protein [Lachnospiraceae bacterium]|nr:helix-turn-helix domain-containing protein [Lachnospiraceae bacterium]